MNRRELNLRDLDAVVAEAKRLHDRGYDRAGKWDLSQVCQHIAYPMNSTLDGFSSITPLPLRIVGKLIFKPVVFRTRKLKSVRAPRETLLPSCDERQSVAALETAVERVKAFNGPWPLHPIFGKLTAAQWREFHVIHGMHHLSFLVPRG